MTVRCAEPNGFCFGVRRAIDTLETALRDYGEVYALGSPIHNPPEVARLERLGLKVVHDTEDVPEGAVVFVRAHGLSPEEMERCRRRNVHLIDGTCPFVSKAQERAAFLSDQGYDVVIVGDENHPEVRGIRGCVIGRAYVVSGPEALPATFPSGKVGVVCQTTQKEPNLAAVVAALVPHIVELRVYNTICGATAARQDAVRFMAQDVDGIIIIGGKNSANTRKLVEIAESESVDVTWVEDPEELDSRWLDKHSILGVAAGASTPDWLIDKLISRLATRRSSRGMEGYVGEQPRSGDH
ncbi:MAG: 4-hydroxy-3-methylbut-2-enyl diphosphate reductase [Synergistales bacterium]|nr:4-hydroxy-3-methylbut-2-enyl diphosphate reductase [Synergistales bacterium]